MMRQTESADNLQATPEDRGWFGGCLDCDGCATIAWTQPTKKRPRGKYIPVIGFQNTNPAIIEALDDVLTKYSVGHWVGWREQRGFGCKPVGDVKIVGHKRIKRFLDVFGICARGKARQLELLREFINHRQDNPPPQPYNDIDDSFRVKIRQLNC